MKTRLIFYFLPIWHVMGMGWVHGNFHEPVHIAVIDTPIDSSIETFPGKILEEGVYWDENTGEWIEPYTFHEKTPTNFAFGLVLAHVLSDSRVLSSFYALLDSFGETRENADTFKDDLLSLILRQPLTLRGLLDIPAKDVFKSFLDMNHSFIDFLTIFIYMIESYKMSELVFFAEGDRDVVRMILEKVRMEGPQYHFPEDCLGDKGKEKCMTILSRAWTGLIHRLRRLDMQWFHSSIDSPNRSSTDARSDVPNHLDKYPAMGRTIRNYLSFYENVERNTRYLLENMEEILKESAVFIHGTAVASIIAREPISIYTINTPFVVSAKDAVDDILNNAFNHRDPKEFATKMIHYFRQKRIRVVNISGGIDEKSLESAYVAFYGDRSDEEKSQDMIRLKDYIEFERSMWTEIICNSSDTLFVMASGNSSIDTSLTPIYPANVECPNTLVVASVDQYQRFSIFSNFGEVDVGALGEGVSVTVPNNFYAELSGTSFAAPTVTKIAGALLNANPDLLTGELRWIILNTVDIRFELQDYLRYPGVVNQERAVWVAQRWETTKDKFSLVRQAYHSIPIHEIVIPPTDVRNHVKVSVKEAGYSQLGDFKKIMPRLMGFLEILSNLKKVNKGV